MINIPILRASRAHASFIRMQQSLLYLLLMTQWHPSCTAPNSSPWRVNTLRDKVGISHKTTCSLIVILTPRKTTLILGHISGSRYRLRLRTRGRITAEMARETAAKPTSFAVTAGSFLLL